MENTKISFEAVSERICLLRSNWTNIKVFPISAYASTEDETEKHPERTEQFYNKLATVVNKCSMRYTFIIGRDFNARTKLSNQTEIEQYLNTLGRYSRNNINRSGRNLIEFCKMHNVKLTNTFYKHKPSQQVTWTSAGKPQNKTGKFYTVSKLTTLQPKKIKVSKSMMLHQSTP